MRPEIIHKPVDPNGRTVQDDGLIERFEFGTMRMIGPGKATTSNIRIQIAQHDDGLWMWAVSHYWPQGGRGYRVGAKWGKFTRTRKDAIAAACHEAMEYERLPGDAKEWLRGLYEPQQMELFS